MNKRKSLILFVFIAVLALAVVIVFVRARGLQKDTCKKTIELNLAQLIRQGKVGELSGGADWQKLDSESRRRLIQSLQKHTLTECGDFLYMVEGVDSDGGELNILVRRLNENGNLEVVLEK